MNEENKFQIVSEYQLAGDQPKAVEELVKGLKDEKREQIFFGITGSGKTFSMANIIERMQKPTLIMAHNKTLAMQLYEEMKSFFPNNAVEYFVSYYDYYQPEVYLPAQNLYLEKDSAINEQIELMRHSATRSLFERRDVIIISSVSCIYGLGSPDEYSSAKLEIQVGHKGRESLIRRMVELQYKRNDIEFERGTFRVKGNVIDVFPSHLRDSGWKIIFDGETVESISEFDPISMTKFSSFKQATLYPNTHYMTHPTSIQPAIKQIKIDLAKQIELFKKQEMIVEAQRIKQRTEYDIEMMNETGTCKGIENFSRYFTGRQVGEPPPTLLEYLPKDALLFIDESHVTVPQIGSMHKGDRSRKENLVNHGFRLPSAFDNRPLTLEEWEKFRPQTIFVSATPAKYELALTNGQCVEQIVRPTGLLDPICEIKPANTQVQDLEKEIKSCIKLHQRVLVTALTKKTAEMLTEYLTARGIKVSYLHSEIKTLNRAEILKNLRRGKIDVIIGVNLLREGLDIPECALVAILDADQEGFLRSETSLIQTIGRAARNVAGRVILYADKVTQAIESAVEETKRRRSVQIAYNKKHGIIPRSVEKAISDTTYTQQEKQVNGTSEKFEKHIKSLKKLMFKEAANFNFEQAAKIRDEIRNLEETAMKNLQ